MARSIIILMLVSLNVRGQSFLLNDIFPTNRGAGSSISVKAPTANSVFQIFPENGGILFYSITNGPATDPQGLCLIYKSITSPVNGVNFAGLPSGNSCTVSPPQQTSLSYTPNGNYVGDDSYVYDANNGFDLATNELEMLVYNTTLPSSTCSGLLYTGQVCNVQLPTNGASYNTNFFFTVYSQTSPCTFSNVYYFNSASQQWGKVQTTTQYPDVFNQFFGGVFITFPNLCQGITLCVSLTGSNSPCVMVPPTNFFLGVVTNSQDTFNLQGSSGTYLISVPPTNGYITNLNASTGQATYVQTNNSATVDQFQYCTSNSSVCVACATVGIGIVNQATCGVCMSVNQTSGGSVTGNIYFNTGVSNENICIDYTNISCVLTTNCTVTDVYGNARFFVQFCPGSSNFCIVQLGGCTSVCYFQHVHVSGSGQAAPFGDGDYYFNAFQLVDPNTDELQIIYTNSVPTSSVIFLYNSNGNLGQGFDECFATVPSGIYSGIFSGVNSFTYYESPSQVFTPGFACPSSGLITGWFVVCGAAPQPQTVSFDSVTTYNFCTTNCP